MKRLLLPLLAALVLPTAVNAELIKNIDDFENSTTWRLWLTSKNKMLFDSTMKMTNPFLVKAVNDGEKSHAHIRITCKKYSDNYRYMEDEIIYDPSAPIVRNGKVELKFDNLPPQVQYLSDKGRGSDKFLFDDTQDLIKRLYRHSTLKIRYITTQGPQIAEFVLDKDKEIAEFWKKCYVDK